MILCVKLLCNALLANSAAAVLATMSASDSPFNAYPLRGNQYSLQNWDWNFDDLPANPHHEPAPAPTADDWDFDYFLHNPVDDQDPAFAYTNATPYNMSSSRAQPGRLPNGYVDLTSPHVDLTEPDSPPRRRKRESPTPGPSSKRVRREDGKVAESSNSKSPDAPIEQIDLSQDDDVLDVLKKQREDAIKAQAKPVETVTTFNSFNCVICMDRPTDITATACGMNSPPEFPQNLLIINRSPVLPHVPHGSSHRRRKPYRAWRGKALPMSRLQEEY